MSASPSKAGAGISPAGRPNPKDASVIAAILRDQGVTEYESRVVHQLLEFAYKYASCVLEDAVLYSNYAGKKNVDSDDVRLAVDKLSDKLFTTPPPKDLLTEIARHKNGNPLPPIKSHAGPRLPPDRYSLISANFKAKTSAAKFNQTPSQGFSIARTTLSGTIRPGQVISLQSRPVSVAKTVINTESNKRKLDSS